MISESNNMLDTFFKQGDLEGAINELMKQEGGVGSFIKRKNSKDTLDSLKYLFESQQKILTANHLEQIKAFLVKYVTTRRLHPFYSIVRTEDIMMKFLLFCRLF